MNPNFIPVTSSNLEGYFYLPETKTLLLAFKRKSKEQDSTYRYDNVPASVVASLATAPSKGVFFGKCIRDKFVATLLTDEEVKQLIASSVVRTKTKPNSALSAEWHKFVTTYPWLRSAF